MRLRDVKGLRYIAETRARTSSASGARLLLTSADRRSPAQQPARAEDRLGGPLTWSAGNTAVDARQLQQFADLREEIERTVDGRERRRLLRTLQEESTRLGQAAEAAAREVEDDEPEYLA